MAEKRENNSNTESLPFGEVGRGGLLVPLSLSHVSDIFRTMDKYRGTLREFLPFVDYTKEEADTRKFVEFETASTNQTFVITYEGKFAGLVGIKDIEIASHRAELGYWLSPDFQNKGIVTQAALRLLQYGFEQLNLNRIQIRVAVANIKSKRVAEKLGAKHEGIMRDGELLVSGYSDIHVFSILKRETIWK